MKKVWVIVSPYHSYWNENWIKWGLAYHATHYSTEKTALKELSEMLKKGGYGTDLFISPMYTSTSGKCHELKNLTK